MDITSIPDQGSQEDQGLHDKLVLYIAARFAVAQQVHVSEDVNTFVMVGM